MVHHIWHYKDLQSRKDVREDSWTKPGWDEIVAYTGKETKFTNKLKSLFFLNIFHILSHLVSIFPSSRYAHSQDSLIPCSPLPRMIH